MTCSSITGRDSIIITSKVKTKCKRATTLHTATCSSENGYGCKGAGMSSGATITYGNLGNKGTIRAGDAFDCDVNGDGTYDTSKERFYYVSELNTNSNYAVLIYYSNVSGGTPTATVAFAYDTSNENWHGPQTGIAQLPTTSQWKNMKLFNTSRAITNEQGGTSTVGGEFPTAFSYNGYAARLLTIQEVNKACGIKLETHTKGELDNCKYLMENTLYHNSIDNKIAKV